MTTLSERYVHAVLRAVPAGQRADLEPEIRALVADAIEAHAGDGTPGDIERAALLELGDPDLLAGRYVDRTRFLIGPQLYGEWLRLVSLVVPIAATVAALASGGASWLGGGTVGEAIAAAAVAAFGVGVQTAFWFTLVFAIAERSGGRDAFGTKTEPWTPDRLPQVPAPERLGLGEAAASIAANVFVIIAIAWMQVASPIVIEGTRYPLFAESLWAFWLPYFIAVAGLEILFAIGLYLRGRWTWTMAVLNALLNAAFAVPALYLLREGLLFNPDLIAALERVTGGAWFATTGLIIGFVIVIAVGIDTIDGFRKALRNDRGLPGVTAIA